MSVAGAVTQKTTQETTHGTEDPAERAREEIARLRYEIEELVTTARALSSERDIRKLLGLILEKCRQVTDAGSVYVLEGEGAPRDKVLHFMLSQNDSLPIDFQELTLPVDEQSIVGKAALGARPINIPDLQTLCAPSICGSPTSARAWRQTRPSESCAWWDCWTASSCRSASGR